MENLYYGLAAAGAIALLAFFLIRKNKLNAQHSQHSSPNIQMTNQKKSLQQSSKLKSNDTAVTKIQQPKKQVQIQQPKIKSTQQLQQQYSGLYFGSFRLKPSNSIHRILSIAFKGPKLLLSTTKNDLTLFNLKEWKKDQKQSPPQKYFVNLDNNQATAVCIGQKYYYAALNFDKTIVYYQFIGEGGVYFKQVAKFARNLLKSNASAIHVDTSQKYIVTAGSGADTVVDVWSMKGEKLATANSYQIQHYAISCGLKDIMIRGWTSEIKIFKCTLQKDGNFKKLQKQHHLAHSQSPLSSSICNRDMYAVSISKSNKPKIWSLFQPHHPAPTPTALPPLLSKCAIYTFEPAIGHFKTLVVLSHPNGFIVTDVYLNIVHVVEGIDVKQLYMNGTNKLVLLGVVNGQGQLMLWNLTRDVEKVGEVNL